MVRAEESGIRLSEQDAALVKGMLLRGDRQHDIASWFGVNGGRVAEVSKGHKFDYVTPITTDLPPPGPYLTGKASMRMIDDLRILRSKVRKVLAQQKTNGGERESFLDVLERVEGMLEDH